MNRKINKKGFTLTEILISNGCNPKIDFLYPLVSFRPAGPHRFFGFCKAGGYGAQNAFQGQHADKTGGFQRGPVPPFWHTTLLARCSVLYLPARLTGETRRAMRFVSRLDRQKNGWRGCVLECARMTAGFAERGQGYATISTRQICLFS